MRKIGTLESSGDAEKFHRFLLSEEIENRIDQVPPEWEIWVFSDNDLDRARAELDSFKNSPNEKRFNVKHVPAPKKDEHTPKTSRRRSTGSSEVPATRFLVVSCVMMTLYTGLGQRHPELMQWLMFSKYVKPETGWQWPVEIMNGEIWRIFTPVFVHGSFWHLVFNMYFLWMLGNIIERTKGSARFLIICLATAAGAHFTQYFIVGPSFIGISGVVYGLLGYLWMKQMLAPEEGYFLPDSLITWMLMWLFLGIFGILDSMGLHIANGAHFGGLLTGMLLGSFPSRRYSVS